MRTRCRLPRRSRISYKLCKEAWTMGKKKIEESRDSYCREEKTEKKYKCINAEDCGGRCGRGKRSCSKYFLRPIWCGRHELQQRKFITHAGKKFWIPEQSNGNVSVGKLQRFADWSVVVRTGWADIWLDAMGRTRQSLQNPSVSCLCLLNLWFQTIGVAFPIPGNDQCTEIFLILCFQSNSSVS